MFGPGVLNGQPRPGPARYIFFRPGPARPAKIFAALPGPARPENNFAAWPGPARPAKIFFCPARFFAGVQAARSGALPV